MRLVEKILTAAGFVPLVAACTSSGLADRVRYANKPPVTAVNDRKPTNEPSDNPDVVTLYHFDALFYRRATRGLELPNRREAIGVNALGEVPDSSWFTNRIGVRDISVDELRVGPNRGPGPEAHKPWTIKSSKTGTAPGFIMKDAAGDRYLVKLDWFDDPEAESGGHVIVQRLLWALGYFVPEDRIVTFERKDLVLDEDATIKDTFGNKRKMTEKDLDAVFANAFRDPGKPYRALVSKFVPGKPVGGFYDEGVRADDPNDKIPHQHRREIRGLQPIFAWLKHTDVKEANTLDAWIKDDELGGRQYVRHYLIDFGKAFGVIGRQSGWKSDGYARTIDVGEIGVALASLGLNKRAWDNIDAPKVRGLGLLEIENYQPGLFEPRTPYAPFLAADERDKLWGAKLLMRFSLAHIRAVVEEARFSEVKTTEYLVRALVARQRKTARYWFLRANPLDNFEVSRKTDGIEACFDDLLRKYELETERLLETTEHTIEVFDYQGKRLPYQPRLTIDTESKRLCLYEIPMGSTNDSYTIISINTTRPGATYEPVLVHVAVDPTTKRPRVVGIRRLDK